MRSMTRDECLAFLTAGTRTGKLATTRPDGRPHVAPIWFVVEDDSLVFNTWHTSVKARNLTANPRAALVVDDQQPPFAYVMVEGVVEISDDLEEVRRIAVATGTRYMGRDRAEEFGARNGVEGELALRLRIGKLIGADEVSA
jgi:PPOX class probable F420-dependent enzyme